MSRQPARAPTSKGTRERAITCRQTQRSFALGQTSAFYSPRNAVRAEGSADQDRALDRRAPGELRWSFGGKSVVQDLGQAKPCVAELPIDDRKVGVRVCSAEF